MILQGKRIRNFDRHFNYLKNGQTVVFGVRDTSRFSAQLLKAGFPSGAAIGATVLPSTVCGPVCRFNANGREIIRRDLPKEKVYRQREWTHMEWHGPNQVEVTDIIDVPYQRYPRDPVPPQASKSAFCMGTDGVPLAVVPAQTVNLTDTAPLLHSINVILGVFGECQAFTGQGAQIIRAPITRLNWQILPPGQRPWPQLRNALNPLISRLPAGKQKLASSRFQTINSYSPDFVATGQGGFNGYLIFAFPAKNLYLCESMYTGNATYVFANDWQQLSQMSKADILNNSLQQDRIVHLSSWANKIKALGL